MFIKHKVTNREIYFTVYGNQPEDLKIDEIWFTDCDEAMTEAEIQESEDHIFEHFYNEVIAEWLKSFDDGADPDYEKQYTGRR